MNLGKFSPYQMFCNLIIACLKPFTVVIESLLHVDVGERYADLSALLALLILGADAEFCPESQSTLMWVLMAVFVIRVVMLRVAGVRRRRRGDNSIHTRSAGTSVVGLVSRRLPPGALPWIEPFVVMPAGLIISLLNPAVGDFVLWSGIALLCINLIRLSAAYNKELDAADARVEQEKELTNDHMTPALATFPIAPMSNVHSVHPGLLAVSETVEEVEPEVRTLFSLGGGEPWKQ